MRVFLQYLRRIWSRVWKDIKQYKWLITAFVVWNVIVRSVFHAFCPVLICIGIPCGGCGITRAIWFILTGQFERGMQLNPVAPIWIGILLYVILVRYILGKSMKRIYVYLGIAVGISLAIYLYRMVTLFPGNPPLVFYKNCIIEQIFPGYMEILKNIWR